MNEAGLQPDFLTPGELAEVQAADELLLSDPQLRETVTYRRHKGSEYDPETGEENPTVETADADVLAGQVDASEVRRAGSRLEVGDHKFLIRQDDLPDPPPTVGDEIDREDGTRLEVIFWREDSVNSLYLIAAREA